ncbi:nucleotidyltransferase family protein [Occallatibacter riparius]|uniref:Nucleotidyltransferase family protein n=1 Tax=Occallatibacter riparius TaxID=1002689 RepID=A0A9J7BIE5_9BACT|nr:nucleotidyltransferase family protein [Occallatibacter riparius]UWZ82265.1 nucleotidyltransferase family protein [Occallatibacter riparius]
MTSKLKRGSRSERVGMLKRAVAAVFAMPGDEVSGALKGFGEDEWQAAMWWLDISGLALYLLDLLHSTGAIFTVPESVRTALEDRAARNRARTRALMKEASALAGWFDASGVRYALLKGFSLTPDSVSDPALRWQTDLDLLVARSHAKAAQHFIARLGYTLHEGEGTPSLSFKAGVAGKPDIAKIYSVHSQRTIEVHIADDDSPLLGRRDVRFLPDLRCSVLSGPDILVKQGTHLLKHLCAEFTKLSWVLEFRRHVEAREGDLDFWNDVKAIASGTPNADLGLMVALWLSETMFGPMTAKAIKHWGGAGLPAGVRAWLTLYAQRMLFSDAIANKYYALLQKQVATSPAAARSIRSMYFPLHVPWRIMEPAPNETARERLQRYVVEAGNIFRRLRFHVVEGARMAIESLRLRRAVAGLELGGATGRDARSMILCTSSSALEVPEG